MENKEKPETGKPRNGENPLGYERIGTLLAKFAVPSIVAMVVSSVYNLVDQIFIGQGVGYFGNAATNVAFPFTTICLALTLTIGIGTAARYSLCLGRGDKEKAAEAVGTGILMMLIFGTAYGVFVLLFNEPLLRAFGATDNIYDYAVTYTNITAIGMPFVVIMTGMSHIARSDGCPVYSMVTMIIGAVINTILDPIFIFVCGWGVAGAAWATVIGQAASAVCAMLYVRRFRRITLRREHFRLSPKSMGRTALMGMSNGLTQVAITIVQVVLNRSLVYYGGLSIYGEDIPLAASGIVMKVNAIVLAVIIGITQGSQPIIGFNYGAKKYDRVIAAYKLAVLCEVGIGLVSAALFQLFPSQILSVFGSGENEELYFSFAEQFMRIFLLLIPIMAIQVFSSNFFAAIGKPVKGAVLSLCRQVFFFIPLVLILPRFFGIDGIMFASPAADILSFITVMIFILIEMNIMKKASAENKLAEAEISL